ncbi:MAG: glycosyltransferase family 9 protein [Phycisphaerales bacterium]
MEAPKRILIIRPSALGDVCRSVPALASLRAAFPESEIDWLVRDVYSEAVSAHPMLTRIVPFARGQLRNWWRSTHAAAALRDFLHALCSANYDLVIDLQGLARSGFFAWSTRAPRRIGLADARELGWLGLTERIRVPRDTHTVDRMLAVVEGAGIPAVRDMRLCTTDAWRDSARGFSAGARYALLAPTSAWAGKRWPIDRFRDVALHLLANTNVERVVVVGGKSERDQCAPLLDLSTTDPRIVDAVGKTSVGELMALVESAAIVIANDSAAAHMAVGFDRPLVCLFGPTRIDRVGPYRREHDVLQHVAPGERVTHKDEAAGRALMDRITTQEVITASEQRLTGAPSVRVYDGP